MENRILVPLDGSRLAEQALPCAMRLGQELPADLVLFRAVSTLPSVRHVLDGAELQTNAVVGEPMSRANDYLQGMVHSLRKTNPNVRHVVRCGPAAEAIVDYAAKTDMRQIIMATHDYGSLRRWTNGSVAEHVVQAANAPVLLVRGRERDLRCAREPISCRRVLVALDGSNRAEQVLPPIATTAQALGCEMILFQVSLVFLFECSTRAAGRMAHAYLKGVAERLENQGIKVSTAVRTGPVAETILRFAKANDVDLIAMSTHGRTGVARRALGSVAAQVLRAGSTPVFLVRAQKPAWRH